MRPDLDLDRPVRAAPWQETMSIAPSATLRHAAAVLARHGIGAVLVRPEGGLDEAGVVSERDLVGAMAAGTDPDTATVEQVMSQGLVAVDVAQPLGDAVRAMVRLGVRHVAVVDGGDIVGVLSARDVLAMLAGDPDPDPDPDPGPLPSIP